MSVIQSNIDKKVIASLKSQKPTCGECVGFSTEVVKGKKLCNGCGVLDSSKPCSQFVPNTNDLREVVEDEGGFTALSRLIARVDDSKLRVLGAVIMREKLTREAGFQMGQKVYVRYRGQAKSNYLSNFMSAYIMYADREVVRIASRDGKINMTFTGRSRDAVISPDEFYALADRMRKRGKFADPEVHRQVAKHLRCLEEHELGLSAQMNEFDIPTIDTVFKANKIKKQKGKNQIDDLVSIVNSIEKGFDVAASKKKKSTGLDSKKVRRTGGVTEIDVT